MSSNYSGRTTPHSDVDHPHRITYSPFREEEDPQPIPMLPPRPPTPGPIALENRGTQTSPKPCPIHQQHVAIMTIHTPPFARQIQQPPTLLEALELRELLRNPTMRNISASSNHLGLTADPKHPLNKNRPPHHLSPFESHIREDSKPRNPPPPSHRPPHPPLPAEKSSKTRERERRNISPANKGRSKETSTELSTTSKGSGIEGWRSSPNNRTNPSNMTTRPSETLTKNHTDFRSSWKFRNIDGG